MATQDEQSKRTETYEIRIQGNLHERWLEWFDGFSITNLADGETLLRGTVVDQAALHGVLVRIRDLNLKLISVVRVIKME